MVSANARTARDKECDQKGTTRTNLALYNRGDIRAERNPVNDKFFIKQPKYITHTTNSASSSASNTASRPGGSSQTFPNAQAAQFTSPQPNVDAVQGDQFDEQYRGGQAESGPHVSYAQGNPAAGGGSFEEELDDDHFVGRQYSFGPPPANSSKSGASNALAGAFTAVGVFAVIGIIGYNVLSGVHTAFEDTAGFVADSWYDNGSGLTYVDDWDDEDDFFQLSGVEDVLTEYGLNGSALTAGDVTDLEGDYRLIDYDLDRLVTVLTDSGQTESIDADVFANLVESGILDSYPYPSNYSSYALEYAGTDSSFAGEEVADMADQRELDDGITEEQWDLLTEAGLVDADFDELATSDFDSFDGEDRVLDNAVIAQEVLRIFVD